MAVTNRLTVFCALLLMVLLFGCAGMQSSGMDYEYNDGWVAYEYNAPLDRAYKSSMHGAFRQHVVMDEVTWDTGAEIMGTMGGQPVTIMLEETGPQMTMVSVKVTETEGPDAAISIHESIQDYLLW